MVKQTGGSLYKVWIEPEVHANRDQLPGKVRQRIKKEINSFARNPRPPTSRPLDTEGLEIPTQVEIRRSRLENWRIVYVVNDAERLVWVLTIQQRPPYNYEDLAEFATRLAE
jgi:mRNA-degrading endonuclease RelE of RelBE toxin-antitoxin system